MTLDLRQQYFFPVLGTMDVAGPQLAAIQGFGGPVERDGGEESGLDGVPLGSAGRVVCHGNRKAEGIGQLRLQFRLPGVCPITVGATRMGKDP